MRRVLIIFILVVLFLSIPAVCAAQNLVITQPSANETTLAEKRDFYVYGIFSGTVSNPGDILIEIYPGDTVTGGPVRTIQSQVDPTTGITNESVIDSAYANATRKNGVIVPDLIKSPGGIYAPSNKLAVTNRYFLGLIQGGVTRDFDTWYNDSSGTPLTDLTAGNYTIEVTGLSGTCSGEKVNKTITLGLTNAILGAFRPQSNKDALTQYGITHNRRIYFDWFPGYFTDPNNSSIWYEAPKRWTPNNGIEVVNDRPGTILDTPVIANNSMFIYNINSGSATYGVELAAILKYSLVDIANTTFLYYDTGEPIMTWNDAGSGSIKTRNGSAVPFPSASRLKPIRVEMMAPQSTSYENLYDPNDGTTAKSIDFDPSDGVTVTSGREFIIYGVTKPIASTVTATSTPYRFSIDNRIAKINCTITDSHGNLVSTGLHDVNLSRLYTAGSSTRFNSLWEYGIEVKDLTSAGTYTISLSGFDVTGSAVSNTDAQVIVTIPAPPVEPVGDDNSVSSAPLVGISPGAPAGQPVSFSFTPVSSAATTTIGTVTLTPSRTIGQVECIVQPVTPGVSLLIAGRDVAGYQSITVNWISPDAIDHADIGFSVSKSWIDEHHIDPETVVMMRYTDNQWVELPTQLVQTSGTVYEYSSTTPGFSYFAITSRASANVNTTIPDPGKTTIFTPATGANPSSEDVSLSLVTSTTTATGSVQAVTPPSPPTLMQIFFPPEGLPLITIAAWAVVIIIVIVVLLLLRKWWIRRQNPALFRKYD
jgi:PGF-pre-PGF domain-containing protein